MMERKTISVELKADDKGTFLARIATLGIVDKDGDLILPGAFSTGTEVLVSGYGHTSWQGVPPVGKAIIREVGNEVLADGQFNLAMQAGKEIYESVKFSGPLQQWSFGFLAVESSNEQINGQTVRLLKKLDAPEISPVLRGSGVDTATIAIKGETKGVISYASAHADGTPKADEGEDWDAGAEGREAEIDDLKAICAWVDSRNPDTKGAYKLPHHKAAGQHPVVWRGVAAAMGALLGARGGVDIPAGDRKGVYSHLAKHYAEFDKEAPEFRSLTYMEHADTALAAVSAFIGRSRSLADLRLKEGRVLSEANRKRLASLRDALRVLEGEISELLDSTEPPEKAARQMLAVKAEYEKLRAKSLALKGD